MVNKIFKSFSIKLMLFHILVGIVVAFIPKLAYVFTFSIVGFGAYKILKNKDQNNEALFLSCYVVGIEVFLRMTNTMFFNEFGKYSIILFCFIGLLFHKLTTSKLLYIVILLLLFPSIIIGLQEASYEDNVRKVMMFNISGQLTLIAASLYTINKNITYNDLKKIPFIIGLPILSIVFYIIVKSPSLKEAMVNTQSNFDTSGGFGPNQVSTVLGLGTFCFFAYFLLGAKDKLEKGFALSLMVICAFRGLMTMSRGGMICGALMIVALMGYVFIFGNSKLKTNVVVLSVVGGIGFIVFWSYSVIASGGMLDKRYNNQDAQGRVKESVLTGRETLIESEFQMFYDNPIFGVGVGRNKAIREEMIGVEAASHNEISRLFAEHGLFGAIVLLLEIMIPLVLWLANRRHILLIPFFIFWALTINHAAMRTAAPSFIYALTLLKVRMDNPTKENEEEKDTVYRQSITA